MIVMDLSDRLPRGFVAAPRIPPGSSIEIDVATYEVDGTDFPESGRQAENGGEATAAWAPPAPILAVATGPPDQDEYEVRVYDAGRGRRLVAAIEVVSPANKDWPDHRRAFVAKCAALVRDRVCVAIVDLVTTRNATLYGDLMEFLGQSRPVVGRRRPAPLRSLLSMDGGGEAWMLETWQHPLALARSLPTLPLWIAGDLAIPLELESSYEQACRVLRISSPPLAEGDRPEGPRPPPVGGSKNPVIRSHFVS